MIVYVDLEHERLRQDVHLWRYFASHTLETKYRLESISGEPCLIVHYDRLNPALLGELDVKAVVVGGHYTGLQHYHQSDLAGLQAVLREAAWPTLGICGGLQVMAQEYGAQVGPMQAVSDSYPETPLPPDETISGPDAAEPEAIGERGFLPIRVLMPHPLFEGLGRQPIVFQLHSWEVKSSPRGFRVLAESGLCRVQTVAHEGALLFGTQFHPEIHDDAHPDGQRILENFFKLAGINSQFTL